MWGSLKIRDMAEALRCTQCGASLPTTLPIPKLDALLAAPEQLAQR